LITKRIRFLQLSTVRQKPLANGAWEWIRIVTIYSGLRKNIRRNQRG